MVDYVRKNEAVGCVMKIGDCVMKNAAVDCGTKNEVVGCVTKNGAVIIKASRRYGTRDAMSTLSWRGLCIHEQDDRGI